MGYSMFRLPIVHVRCTHNIARHAMITTQTCKLRSRKHDRRTRKYIQVNVKLEHAKHIHANMELEYAIMVTRTLQHANMAVDAKPR